MKRTLFYQVNFISWKVSARINKTKFLKSLPLLKIENLYNKTKGLSSVVSMVNFMMQCVQIVIKGMSYSCYCFVPLVSWVVLSHNWQSYLFSFLFLVLMRTIPFIKYNKSIIHRLMIHKRYRLIKFVHKREAENTNMILKLISWKGNSKARQKLKNNRWTKERSKKHKDWTTRMRCDLRCLEWLSKPAPQLLWLF